MPLESSPEAPVQVRTVAKALLDWIGKLGRVWVEGQVVEITRRPGQATAYFVLRDTAVDMSLRVSCKARMLDDLELPLTQGARIVVWGKPEYYANRGSLSFVAAEIRPVGLGALLARIEELRGVLAAEGLFAAERKRPLPFLPKKVGLITGRASAAEHDVVNNARRRWPGVDFEIEPVAVQGSNAVTEVIEALARLDRDSSVDVIVIARGGGSMEDLLPFSDETLVRAVSAASTPVVSAIGHETDIPLLDHVADRRASTPTDAAKLIVPDVAEEFDRISNGLLRIRNHVVRRIETERQRLEAIRTRPVLADPSGVLISWRSEVALLRDRSHRATSGVVTRDRAAVIALSAQVSALSPQATLDRGYAVLQTSEGAIVRDPVEVKAGDRLVGRVAAGQVPLVVEATQS